MVLKKTHTKAMTVHMWAIIFAFIIGAIVLWASSDLVERNTNQAFAISNNLLCQEDPDNDSITNNDPCPCDRGTLYVVRGGLGELPNTLFHTKNQDGEELRIISSDDLARLENYMKRIIDDGYNGQTIYVSAELSDYLKTTSPELNDFCFSAPSGTDCTIKDFRIDYLVLDEQGEYAQQCKTSTKDCKKILNDVCRNS